MEVEIWQLRPLAGWQRRDFAVWFQRNFLLTLCGIDPARQWDPLQDIINPYDHLDSLRGVYEGLTPELQTEFRAGLYEGMRGLDLAAVPNQVLLRHMIFFAAYLRFSCPAELRRALMYNLRTQMRRGEARRELFFAITLWRVGQLERLCGAENCSTENP